MYFYLHHVSALYCYNSLSYFSLLIYAYLTRRIVFLNVCMYDILPWIYACLHPLVYSSIFLFAVCSPPLPHCLASLTLLKLTIARIKVVRNKRSISAQKLRKEIANLIQSGQDAHVYITKVKICYYSAN